MAQFSVNKERFDPYKNFKFRVKTPDGQYVAGVSKVSALKRTTEVVKHREGGDPSSSRKSPGRTEYDPITLERGVTHDKAFEQWANKVWQYGVALGQEVSLKDFRSVAYQASVVLIEEDISTQNALPVLTRNIYAVPFDQPSVEQILAQPDPNQPAAADRPGVPITLDKTLLIQGHKLQGGKGTLVQMNGMIVQPGAITDTQITLPLAAASGLREQDGANIALVDGLRAGVQGLQVIHRMQMGADQPGDELNWHRGVESNVAAFVLRPALTADPTFDAGKATVTLRLKPIVGRPQRAVLLLNEFSPTPRQPGAPPARAHSFIARPLDQTWKDSSGQVVPNDDPGTFSDQDSTDTITFSIPGVAAGAYLVRVQVDGAESVLEVDTKEQSPTFNRYIRPQVSIS